MCITYEDILKAAEGSLCAAVTAWIDDGRLIRNFPELAALDEYVHRPEYHPEGNPLDHTLCAVEAADSLGLPPVEKAAVLFHDLGKGVTAEGYDSASHPYHHFYGHEKKGLPVFRKLAKRLSIPEEDRQLIAFCMENHMKVHIIREMRVSKVRGLVLSPYWHALKMVAYCDEASRKDAFDAGRFRETMAYADSVSREPEERRRA